MSTLGALLPPWGTWAGELARLALVCAAFGLVMVAAEVWRWRFAPPVEWTRKAVHFGGGFVIATLPWVLSTHWSVLALVALTFVGFGACRRMGWLTSITGVARPSAGERWYPIGVYLLFVVARHQPVFWLIALSALIVSDTGAALLGTAYGRHVFLASGDRKSVEGSVAFLVVIYLALHALPEKARSNRDHYVHRAAELVGGGR